jgi:hypothetical protein
MLAMPPNLYEIQAPLTVSNLERYSAARSRIDSESNKLYMCSVFAYANARLYKAWPESGALFV